MSCSFKTNFCILPLAVSGYDATKRMYFGTFWRRMFARQYSRSSGLVGWFSGFQFQQRHQLLAHKRIGHTDNLGFGNFRMAHQKGFAFRRKDVFAAMPSASNLLANRFASDWYANTSSAK